MRPIIPLIMLLATAIAQTYAPKDTDAKKVTAMKQVVEQKSIAMTSACHVAGGDFNYLRITFIHRIVTR
jgi:hypothetical protein